MADPRELAGRGAAFELEPGVAEALDAGPTARSSAAFTPEPQLDPSGLVDFGGADMGRRFELAPGVAESIHPAQAVAPRAPSPTVAPRARRLLLPLQHTPATAAADLAVLAAKHQVLGELPQRIGQAARQAGVSGGGAGGIQKIERQLFEGAQRGEAERSALLQEQLAQDAHVAGQIAATQQNALEVAENARREREETQRLYEGERARQVQALEKSQRELETFEPDSGRWFGNLSTGGKIAAVIASVLGGVSAALNKTPDAGASMIQKMIEDDVRAQFEGKKAGVAGRQTLLDVTRKHFGDDQEASAAAEAMMWEHAAREADHYAQAAIPDDKKRLAAEQASLYRQNAEQARLQWDVIAQQKAAAARAAASAAAAGPKLETMNPEDRKRLVNVRGVEGLASDPDAAKNIREKVATAEELDQVLAELEAEEGEGLALVGGRSEALTGRAHVLINKAFGLGALDAGATELLKSMITDPRSLRGQFAGRAKDQLKLARELNQRSLEGATRASGGITPVARGVAPNRKGELREQSTFTGEQPGVPAAAPRVDFKK